MTYSPQYVTFEEIPVQIPDDYSDDEKAAALEFAESSAELDINDGDGISQSLLSNAGVMIVSAIKQKATCELAKGAEHPDDTALTDLSDTGADKADYAAEAFCDRYDELVEKITNSGLIGDDEPGSTAPYVYSTNDPTPDDDYQEETVDEDDFNRYN
jgi:hypothetical protein